MVRSSRFAFAALLPLGVVLGHGAGYLIAGEHTHGYLTHGPLLPLVWVAAAAAIGAVGWFGLRGVEGPQWPRLSRVALVQAFVFFLQEGTEHVVHGHGFADVVAAPSFRWGLAAQVVTAGILLLAASMAQTTAKRLRTMLVRPARTGRPKSSMLPALFMVAARSTVLASPASERGPPRPLVSA